MREAKSLGIPLRQPGTGRRRASVSQLTDSQLSAAAADADHQRAGTGSGAVWSCSNCHQTVIDYQPPAPPRTDNTTTPPRQHTPPAAVTAPLVNQHKTSSASSPFKDMFRVANFFGRKVKDESRSKVTSGGKQALTLPRGHVTAAVCCEAGPEVTSSPAASRRHVESGGESGVGGVAGRTRVKYRRSASTPRPAGDTHHWVSVDDGGVDSTAHCRPAPPAASAVRRHQGTSSPRDIVCVCVFRLLLLSTSVCNHSWPGPYLRGFTRSTFSPLPEMLTSIIFSTVYAYLCSCSCQYR